MYLKSFLQKAIDHDETLSLFLHHLNVKFAGQAVADPLAIDPMHLPAAKRAGYCPARSPGIDPAVDAVQAVAGRRGADTEFRGFVPARASPAFQDLPAIPLGLAGL